ncbi:MAG: hypothetical protein HZC51_05890 [Nitrospirae bacterium]|nr:hypothetical protein [Nitrospirota bacterium]
MMSLEETLSSLTRIQEFDPATLPREAELGKGLSFQEAVLPASKLIGLYKQLPTTILDDLPINQLDKIKARADADYTRLQQILTFSADQGNPVGVRDSYINQLNDAYTSSFNELFLLISYGVSRTVDFTRLENEARSTVQSIIDKTNNLTTQLENSKQEAQNILEDIRKVAAEHGVSQQAIYFKEESEKHATKAEEWRVITRKLAILLGVFSVISFIVHKIPWITPVNSLESAQLIVSKVLVFGVISYTLILAAKNFLAHEHNAIVNKHRQNALMTFNALVEAAKYSENRDIILNHAAACIYAPQETGYSKSSSGGGSGKTLVELIPSMVSKIDTH